MSDSQQQALDVALRRTALALSELARYCDHVEHAEAADPRSVSDCARVLREVAAAIAASCGFDLVEAYAARLDDVESAFVLGISEGFEGGAHVRLAETWRDLQLIQAQHDRVYRPDVNGLSRADQTRHVCLHVAKLVGSIAAASAKGPESLRLRTAPDLLLLGIKLSTVVGERLAEAPIRANARRLSVR